MNSEKKKKIISCIKNDIYIYILDRQLKPPSLKTSLTNLDHDSKL